MPYVCKNFSIFSSVGSFFCSCFGVSTTSIVSCKFRTISSVLFPSTLKKLQHFYKYIVFSTSLCYFPPSEGYLRALVPLLFRRQPKSLEKPLSPIKKIEVYDWQPRQGRSQGQRSKPSKPLGFSVLSSRKESAALSMSKRSCCFWVSFHVQAVLAGLASALNYQSL